MFIKYKIVFIRDFENKFNKSSIYQLYSLQQIQEYFMFSIKSLVVYHERMKYNNSLNKNIEVNNSC